MNTLFLHRAFARWLRFWYLRVPIPYELSVLLVSLFPRLGKCRIHLLDMELELDPSDLVQANILLDGVWEHKISCWWAYLSSSAEIIMDIGAHCGYFSLISRRFAPDSAHIYSFEPNPRMQRQWERNVAINNFSNMYLVPLAVSDGTRTMPLHVRKFIEPGASSCYRVPYSNETIVTQTVALDAYCDENGIEQVDVVKMDIEGGEADALRGMYQGLRAGRYGTIIIEMHCGILSPSAVQTMLADLRAARYTLFTVENDHFARIMEGPLPPDSNYMMAVHSARLSSFESTDNGRQLLLPEQFRDLF